MQKVKLYTAEGEFVTAGQILPFNKAPEVLFWGERVFVFSHPCGDALEYREALTYVLLPELTQTSA